MLLACGRAVSEPQFSYFPKQWPSHGVQENSEGSGKRGDDSEEPPELLVQIRCALRKAPCLVKRNTLCIHCLLYCWIVLLTLTCGSHNRWVTLSLHSREKGRLKKDKRDLLFISRLPRGRSKQTQLSSSPALQLALRSCLSRTGPTSESFESERRVSPHPDTQSRLPADDTVYKQR